MHGGRTYRVEEISYTGSGGEIGLGPVEPFLRTNTYTFTTVTEQDIYDARQWTTGDFIINAYYGKVLIVEALTSVEKVDERTGEVKDRWAPQVNSAQCAATGHFRSWQARSIRHSLITPMRSGCIKKTTLARQHQESQRSSIYYVSALSFPSLWTHTTCSRTQ